MMEAGLVGWTPVPDRFMDTVVGACFVAAIVFLILRVMAVDLKERRARKQRQQVMTSWARSRGLRFHYEYDSRFAEYFEGFSCLQKGDNQYAYNIYKGISNGHHLLAFDYNCGDLRPGAKRDIRDDFSAVIVTTDMQLKPLFIQPRYLREKLTEFCGYGNIDFESAEFSSEFYVKSPDKRWAYDVLNQSTMEFLLTSPRFTLQFAGSGVIAYNGYRFEASEFEAALTLIEGVLQRLPSSLVHELQTGRQDA